MTENDDPQVEQDQTSIAKLAANLKFDEKGDPLAIPSNTRASVWAAEFFLVEQRPLIMSKLLRRFLGFKVECKECGNKLRVPGESNLGKFLLERTDKFLPIIESISHVGTPLGNLKALASRLTDAELDQYTKAAEIMRQIENRHGLDVVEDGCQVEEATD